VGALAALPVGGPQRNGSGHLASRKEVYATTIVVILTSIFFGVYLAGVDFILTRLMDWLLGAFRAA